MAYKGTAIQCKNDSIIQYYFNSINNLQPHNQFNLMLYATDA